MCHGMHVAVQEQPESALFPSEDSRKQTQVFRLGCKGPCQLTHVISPCFRISNNTSFLSRSIIVLNKWNLLTKIYLFLQCKMSSWLSKYTLMKWR